MNTRITSILLSIGIVSVSLTHQRVHGGDGGAFADILIDFAPAPGQFVNNPNFNNPAKALGAPVGDGLNSQDTSKVVSLGGFGGVIVLGFSQTVWDDPCNPYGLDAIVFGNAIFALGDPNRRFAEAAVIEISRDANNNGIADDPWYLIRGSHLPDPIAALHAQTWDTNTADPTNPPNNPAWIPTGQSGVWQTINYRLPALFESTVVVNPSGPAASLEGYFGYADCTPVLILGDTDADDIAEQPGMDPQDFYTVADNPFAVGVSPGSGGGDAFDIAWAIDPADGFPAHLDGFDFIRISTAVHFIAGPLGELSAEIGGVSDARADASFFESDTIPGVDVEDLYAFHHTTPADFTGEGAITPADSDLLERCARADEAADIITTP